MSHHADLAKNYHFRVWLNAADKTNMNPAVTKKLEREDLFLLLSFCFGFAPQDEPCECLGRI